MTANASVETPKTAVDPTSDSANRAHMEDLVRYIQASPSSFHAADEIVQRLSKAGATVVDEREPWPDVPGAYVMRRGGAAVAWIVPNNCEVKGFHIVGSHTDSPGFRIKPNPESISAGYAQIAVEVYGGALLGSWTDREIEFAGRVVDKHGHEHLVRTGPIARIPQLAIHLNRAINDEGLKLDRQRHTAPVLGLETFGVSAVDAIARAAGVAKDEIVAWDLYSCDTQPPRRFGASEEFLAAGRLDNLLSVHASLVAFEQLVNSGVAGVHAAYAPVLIAFDHEEVGSASTSGAAGPLLHDVLLRIATAAGQDVEGVQRAFRNSVCLSVDGAHAVHPNYTGEYEPGHWPVLDGGPVIKINANQRYATNAVTQALMEQAAASAAERLGNALPLQYFVSANHKPCGSTIGPITATRLGIDTVDAGAAMLSMHSAREMCGTRDPWWLKELIAEFWRTSGVSM